MVYFSCSVCGEALKRAKVDSHWGQCHNDFVTCIDCNVDFYGNDYKSHMQCVSEAERYQKSLYKGPKTTPNNGGTNNSNNGAEDWLDILRQKAESCNDRGVVELVCTRMLDGGLGPNIPFKKKKWENFAKNSMRIWNDGLVSKVWDLIDLSRQEFRDAKNAANSNKNSNANDSSNSTKNTTNNSNSANSSESSDDEKESECDAKSVNWENVISEILGGKKSLKLKKLRRKIKEHPAVSKHVSAKRSWICDDSAWKKTVKKQIVSPLIADSKLQEVKEGGNTLYRWK